jgi:hypothetical protein
MKSDYKLGNLYFKLVWMKERLKQPSTRWKIWWVCLALISMYYNLNYRITALEDFRQSVDVIQLQTDIAQMKIDLQRIKNDLQKNK